MPEESLRTITGQIITINQAKRGIAVRNAENISEGFTWDPAQDKEFSRLQAGWYAKVTLEKRGELWIAISQAKAPRPGGSRKTPQEPAQDKRMIMKSVLIKAWTHLWQMTNTPDAVTFADARREVRDAVDEDLEWAMGGAA